MQIKNFLPHRTGLFFRLQASSLLFLLAASWPLACAGVEIGIHTKEAGNRIITEVNWKTNEKEYRSTLETSAAIEKTVKGIVYAKGTCVVSNTLYSFASEYCGNVYKPKILLPQEGFPERPWQNVHRRLIKAKSFGEEILCYTPESWAILEDLILYYRQHLPKLMEKKEKKSKGGPTNTERLHFILNCAHGNEQTCFVVYGLTSHPPEKAGPPFAMDCFRRYGAGGWEIDLKWDEDPIGICLDEGHWKQFGAPRDFSDSTR